MSRKDPHAEDGHIRRLLRFDFTDAMDGLSEAGALEVQEADAVQFLARLHLLAVGDTRQSDLLSDPKQTLAKQALAFEVAIPVGFLMPIEYLGRKDGSVRFGKLDCDRTDTGNPDTARFITVGAWVDSGKVTRLSNVGLLVDPFYRKRIAAAGLLETLGNMSTPRSFEIDPDTLSIQRNERRETIQGFIEYIADGKVSACPICGRPVLLARESSTPFCKKPHYIRYNNRAKRMFEKGATVEEVAAAFPYINEKTIANW